MTKFNIIVVCLVCLHMCSYIASTTKMSLLSFAMHAAHPWMSSWSDFPTFSSSDPILWNTKGNDAFLEYDLLARTTLSTAILLFSNLQCI